MIGVSLGDLIKLLDQVPGWKALTGLPKRVKELEERVAALEAEPAKPPTATLDPCPMCGGQMRVTRSVPHRNSAMRRAAILERTLTCIACGHAEGRVFDPTGAMTQR